MMRRLFTALGSLNNTGADVLCGQDALAQPPEAHVVQTWFSEWVAWEWSSEERCFIGFVSTQLPRGIVSIGGTGSVLITDG